MDKITVKPEWIVYPSIKIEANPDHDPDLPSEDLDFEIGHSCKIEEDSQSLHINITIDNSNAEDSNAPYSISIKLYARFLISCDPSKLPSKTKLEIFEDIAALAFGSLREHIATITSRAPWGTHLIPLLSYQELAKNILETLKEEKQAKSNSKRQTAKQDTKHDERNK